MNICKYPRSFLFTSALHKNGFGKAQEVGAGVCVIDLEDSVPSGEKEHARIIAREFFSTDHDFVTGLRINNIRSLEGINDILLLLDLKFVPNIIILPMVVSCGEIIVVRDLLRSKFTKSNEIKIFALIETSGGLINISEIGKVSSGLIFGSADFATEMGVTISNECMIYARHIIALVAVENKIPAIDAPCFNLNNTQTLETECLYAQKLGFRGKLAVHPSQVATINNTFSPSEEQILWAKRVVEEFDQADHHICKIGSEMIGPPFARMAKKILQLDGLLQYK